MSKFRPTLSSNSTCPCLRDGTAYLTIYRSVQRAFGLLHGELENAEGQACAIGHFFKGHPGNALPNSLIDEVAAVNDSLPERTMRQRKRAVLKWLRWRMGQLGLQP